MQVQCPQKEQKGPGFLGTGWVVLGRKHTHPHLPNSLEEQLECWRPNSG